MPRETQPVETVPTHPRAGKDRTKEVHPAFGLARVNRHSVTPGAVLFDSQIRHGHTVVLTISEASRTRDLQRDWLYAERAIIEIEMSEAQWGALVSSFGDGRGTPVTIRHAPKERRPMEIVPGLEFESRMALSAKETHAAAEKAFEEIKEASAAVEEKPTKANIRTLMNRIENGPKNVEFASKSLTEHVENVVTKAKADIEAMVTGYAADLGITAADVPRFELESGTVQGTVVEES